jgi:DNA-binding GntR family transcriptional regulator
MLDVKVDRGDPTDLYEQIAGEIRRATSEGEAKPGERLPPLFQLEQNLSGGLLSRGSDDGG